ncbi:MAG TPA: glycosyltransferase family 4 protein [Vicinamibacteria bacterium]
MRVALLSRGAHPLHAPGGLERAVYHLARSLERRGVETVLFTRPATHPGRFPGEVVEVPYGGDGAGHGRVFDRSWRYPRFAARLGEAVAARVRAGMVDVVDAQGLCALGYGRLRRREPGLRAPLVMNPQGMEEHQTRGLKRLALTRLRRLSRQAAGLADRVIATDEATRADVPRLLGVAPGKVAVVPNGVDLDEIAEATPAEPRAVAEEAVPGLRGADLVVLSVGRLEGYKGFGDVREALRRLEARGALPARWAWVLVGTGPDADRLAALEGLGGRLQLPGRVSDAVLHALYARADVFVHATRYEGSSLVTLEAMAHGLPVVATRAGGIPDKVVEGETGHLVEPGDVAALAQRLEALAGAPERRREMGARGNALVASRFSWSRIVERVLALYDELRRPAA